MRARQHRPGLAISRADSACTTGRGGARGSIWPVNLHPAARGFQTAGTRYERGRPDYPPSAIDWLVARLGARRTTRRAGARHRRGHRQVDAAAARAGTAGDRGRAGGRDARDARAERAVRRRARRPGRGAPAPGGGGRRRRRRAGVPLVRQPRRRCASSRASCDPHGRLGLVWNRRDLDQPLQAAIGRLIAPYRADAPAHASDAWRAAFTRSAPFAPVVERRVAHTPRRSIQTGSSTACCRSASSRHSQTTSAERSRRACVNWPETLASSCATSANSRSTHAAADPPAALHQPARNPGSALKASRA